MKRSHIAVITLALGATCINSLAADPVTIMGESSCGTWVNEKSAYHKAWLLGYLSGMAMGSEINLLQGTDYNSIYLWMDNYCKNNPLKRVGDGGLDLAIELARNKKIKGAAR